MARQPDKPIPPAFIIYVYKETDPDVKQCLVLSNLLCNCGIDCDIDQYYRNHNILDWVNWVSERINFCISRKGYILLECSQAMYTSLENTKDNHRIQMAVAHVDCFTLRNFIRKHTDRFIPFYTDTKSCDYTPGCLSLKPIYHLPINLLPENFALEILDKRSVLDLTILENPNFVSLKRLVATLTGQQEIAKPAIGKPYVGPTDDDADSDPDVIKVKEYYDRFLTLMPVKHEDTISKLLDYLSDDQIAKILADKHPNKAILDNLYKKITCREDLLDFFHVLEISNVPQSILNELRHNFQPRTLKSSSSLEQQQQHESILQKMFSKLVTLLPTNPYFSCNYLKKIKKFSDIFIVLDDVISNPDTSVVCDYILWYTYTKCNGDIVEFYKIVEGLIVTDTKQQLYVYHKKEYKSILLNKSMLSSELTNSKDFATLHECYHFLHHLLPTNYYLTTGKLQKYLNEKQISDILRLNHDDYTNANKRIIMFLTEKITRKEHLFDFCSQLEMITTSHYMASVVKSIRLGLLEAINSKGTEFTCVPQPPNQSHQPCPLSTWYQYLPRMPQHYISREQILEKMVAKLYYTDAGQQNITLTVTGIGGNGKTTLVTALCYHPSVKKKFNDHILFISLGPQASDPTVKLTLLFCDLTGTEFSGTIIDNVKVRIKNALAKLCCHEKLVIVDDVWYAEDAQPIVDAFNGCHIVLCTRRNDIAQYMDTKHTIIVDEMKLHEGVNLLCLNFTEVECNTMLTEDRKALEELAKDAHLWPILLHLINGQLYHHLKVYNLSYHEAIQAVKTKLYDRGLTCFDMSNFGAIQKNRNKSVNACITMTLNLLSNEVRQKLYTLILFTGIGGSFPKLALHSLWNISERRADDVAFILWKNGLVSLKHIILPPYYKYYRDQKYIVTHTVISEYIINSIMIKEVADYSPFIFLHAENKVSNELISLFKKCYGANDITQLTPRDYLIYTLHKIEYVIIPFYLKGITMHTLHDPPVILAMLQRVQVTLYSLFNTNFDHFSKRTVSLNEDCHKLLKSSQKSNILLNAKAERYLFDRNYKAIAQTIELHCKTASIEPIALRCTELVKDILLHADSAMIDSLKLVNEMFMVRTPELHPINMEKMPIIKKYIELHEEINSVLTLNSNSVWELYKYLTSGMLNKELQLITDSYLIKLGEISPAVLKSSLLMYNK